MADEKIINAIQDFIAQLKNEISIKSVYLFGSYVKGTNKEYSDIDVAIVSDSFKGSTLVDIERILSLTKNINRMIEPHPFRSEDFTEDDPFVKEIITTGIKVA
ncbi:MAG: nucleotidyltransferase domain-containing protein [candidate division KSB1 bacterium]|nr:nucleotidyltransferase domain-containing protein [candidate division KSB1 bacterium]